MSYSEQIKTQRTEVQTMQNQAKELHADLDSRVKKLDGLKGEAREQAERDIQGDQVKLDNLITDGKSKRAALDRLIQLEDADQFLNRPADQPKGHQRGAGPERAKSWGETVVSSPEFKASDKYSADPRMNRVNVKALAGDSPATGGVLIQTQRQTEMLDMPFRPRSILDLVDTVPTTSNAVDYTLMTNRINNAEIVPEGGLKPESSHGFDLKTVNMVTIAHFEIATRQILADAPGLRSLIDNELTEMLRIKTENKVMTSTDSRFVGILATTGILTRTQGTGARADPSDTVADTIRRAITDVRLEFYDPNAVVLNPADTEALELIKGSDQHYVEIFDPTTGRIWRVAVAETAAITAKTAIVGDLKRGARLWDRQETEIRVGEPNDLFFKNQIAVLAELRCGFAVVRPRAIAKVTFN